MSELNACFALCDIERFKMRLKKREMIAKRYQYNLKNSSWKALEPIEGKSSYYKQIIISPIKRKKLLKYLLKKKIQLTGGVYNIPIHNQSRYKNVINLKNFKNSNFFSNYHICPPCYPEMSFKQVDYICEKFLEINY
jgi:dTDP-4-amino-4,6-dideoxygalactose transaminase